MISKGNSRRDEAGAPPFGQHEIERGGNDQEHSGDAPQAGQLPEQQIAQCCRINNARIIQRHQHGGVALAQAMGNHALTEDTQNTDNGEQRQLRPVRRHPEPDRRNQREERIPERVIKHDHPRRLGALQPLDADHHQSAKQRAGRADEGIRIEAFGERPRVKQDADEADDGDDGAAPAGNLAQEDQRQRNHEQRPRELQRHGIRQQHMGDGPEEAGIADRAGGAAQQMHAETLGAQRLQRVAQEHRHHQQKADQRAKEQDLDAGKPGAEEFHHRRHDHQRHRACRYQHGAARDRLHGMPARQHRSLFGRRGHQLLDLGFGAQDHGQPLDG